MQTALLLGGGVVIVGAAILVLWLRRRGSRPSVADRKLVEPGLATPPRDPERGRARKLRRKRRMDPRANGHSKEDGNLR